jgi:hypothetical protein
MQSFTLVFLPMMSRASPDVVPGDRVAHARNILLAGYEFEGSRAAIS